MAESAIVVKHVYKDFVLPHEKANTIKAAFTGIAKGRRGKSEVQHALKDISFEINNGEFFGIVGRNGSGKSTLLKILAGIYQPNGGTVEVKGRLVPFIELGVGFNAELTGRENVYLNGAMLGFSRKELDAMYDDIVKFAELERFMDQKLKNYSSGMQVRLAFSMATRAEADILLVDEVLAVGDADFQRKCFKYFKNLKKLKKTVVFVSHDMGAVREFCDRALLIDKSEVKLIGKTDNVASSYSQLFVDESDSTVQEERFSNAWTRWGDGRVRIADVTSKVTDKELIVRYQATVSKPLDNVLYGIHIVDSDGSEVTAMNNRMIQQPDIKKLQAGQKIEFIWRMQNIFNDGQYDVTLTLVDDAGIAFDWYTEATSFKVSTIRRSTTAVLAPVEVKVKVEEGD